MGLEERMNEIEKKIEAFKNRNGNKEYKQKDLLMYIVEEMMYIRQRIDSLPCDSNLKMFKEDVAKVTGAISNTNSEIKDIERQLTDWKWIAGLLITIGFGAISSLFALYFL